MEWAQLISSVKGALEPPVMVRDIINEELRLTGLGAGVRHVTSSFLEIIDVNVRLGGTFHRQRQSTRSSLASVQRELTYIVHQSQRLRTGRVSYIRISLCYFCFR